VVSSFSVIFVPLVATGVVSGAQVAEAFRLNVTGVAALLDSVNSAVCVPAEVGV